VKLKTFLLLNLGGFQDCANLQDIVKNSKNFSIIK